MLTTGNQINSLDSYSFETAEGFRGLKTFNQVGLAIVDPSRPSREIPFMIYSKQKGKEPIRYSIPRRAYVYRVGIRVPKEVVWENPTSGTNDLNGIVQSTGDMYIEGVGTSATESISLPIDPAAGPLNARRIWDASMVWAKIPGSNYGQFYGIQQFEDNTYPDSPVLIKRNFEGYLQRCQIMSHDWVGTGLPGNPLRDDWKPVLKIQPSLIAPTTNNGKKSAIILEVSGYLFDEEPISSEKALSGISDYVL